MTYRRIAASLLIFAGSAIGLTAQAVQALRLPAVFSDHMVLQGGARAPVWGWAKPGAEVSVAIAGRSQRGTANSAGRWRIDLADLPTGGPHELVVEAGTNLRIKDVLIGEVWLASGQSNMAMRVAASNNAAVEAAAAELPQIRMFTVKRAPSLKARDDCQGRWVVCSPATVKAFSASAYFFGRRLHQDLGVPMGLINSSVGGTPIEAWTSLPAQRAEPSLAGMLQGVQRRLDGWRKRAAKTKASSQRRPQNPALGTAYPANLFHGMIHPLVPFGIRGAIWYQGERNARNVTTAQLYRQQLPLLIRDWRQHWGQGEFPFLFVQLPNFKPRQADPNHPSSWAVMRESMLHCLSVPHTGMAVTIDVGMARNIHPKNKQAVGERLALWALAKVYQRDVQASGPLFDTAKPQGSNVLVSFRPGCGSLQILGDGELMGFAIAGADKKFRFAKAEIQGQRVRVWHPEIRTPVAVRYAWGDNPACKLGNTAGLPASPFRSDTWDLE